MEDKIGITVTHDIITCSLCNRTYSVLSTSLHTCPYCKLDFYTKLKQVNSEKVDVAPVEIDLSDLSNYVENYFYNQFGQCHGNCDLNKNIGCENKGFACKTKIRYDAVFKLKPEIKADLESGKAVAKGGRK